METPKDGRGRRDFGDLETFLRGMETSSVPQVTQRFYSLETFLRGMETRFLILGISTDGGPLKPSLEGWKPRSSVP